MSKEYDFELRAQLNAIENMRNVGMSGFQNGGLAAVMTEEQKKRHTAKLDETRQLKGHFTDYASEFIDCTSPCERISDIELLLSRESTFKFEDDIDWCVQARSSDES